MYSLDHIKKQDEIYQKIDTIVNDREHLSQSDYQACLEAIIIEALQWTN